jgi:hypothetical protein
MLVLDSNTGSAVQVPAVGTITPDGDELYPEGNAQEDAQEATIAAELYAELSFDDDRMEDYLRSTN